MSNDITVNDDDDGYNGSITGGRLIKGILLRWNETNGWMDRDGLRPPEIMMAIAISEAEQRWKQKKIIELITIKPLPDLNTLNEAVPKSEWELGLDGKPKPPWVHTVLVYLVDPASGAFFTYAHSTTGAHIAWDQLREKVITMRALRGSRVVPIVKLTHRPMKTAFGMKNRPEFEVVDWRQAGDGGGLAISGPQLEGPSSATPTASKAKTTLDHMTPVEPVILAEEMDDEIEF